MEPFTENTVLKTLQEIFLSYKKDKNTVNKADILRLFFEFNIMDVCGYDIFQISNFLNELNPTNDEMEMKHFFLLVFYIYKTEIQADDSSVISDMSVDLVNNFSGNRKEINTSNNIIKLLISQQEKIETPFMFESPNFKNETILKIVSYDLLTFISHYAQSIKEKIYGVYCGVDPEKNVEFMNVTSYNNFIFNFPLFVNFNTDELMKLSRNFIKIELTSEEETNTFRGLFEKKLTYKEVQQIFNTFLIPTEYVNFSFSSFVIILAFFALNLKSSEDAEPEERIKFFFETQLELTRDDSKQTKEILKDQEEDQEVDFLPESEALNKAKLRDTNNEQVASFIEDFLSSLDRSIPEEDQNIMAFSNDIPNHSNTLAVNPFKPVPVKFPVERLDIEVQEEKERALQAKENAQIMRAAKPKRKEKDKNPNPLEFSMEEVPNEDIHNLKYFGKPRIDTLTHRFLKQTYKEILPYSNVYPSLIKEVLMIPSILPSKTMEIIVESFKDQVSGHIETAIRRLEKARDNLPKECTTDDQTNLFFELQFGSLYESLDLDIEAIKYYNNAKYYSEKLQLVDPDRALVFCFLGELFIKLKEYIWAMRCFLQAKQLRESTIGGDTPDTASVYNNLGVVSFYLQSYLPANGYFKLAYEIYRTELGLNHPRTMLIKSNLTKMNELSFNKIVEFKTLSMYPTPEMVVPGKRKKK